jgi:hypothetical protein
MMVKKVCLVLVVLAVGFVCDCCSWFPGIFYPKKNFGFKNMNEVPPLFIGVVPGGSINSFKKQFSVRARTSKQYDVLCIKRMSYEWEGNTGDFLIKNGYFEWHLTVNESFSKDEYYQYHFFRFLKFNPEKFFKGKKIGDEFKFYLIVEYSFDDEPKITQVFEYNVHVTKGEYDNLF